MNADDQFGRYAHSLLLFAVGVVLLAHGAAATALAGDVPPLLTAGLPFVGVSLAYRSLARHLPADSPLSSNGVLLALAAATTGFVNVAIPPFYEFVGVFEGTTPTVAGGYWSAFVAGVSGLGALSVYHALAVRVRGRRNAFAWLLGAFVVSVIAAALLLYELPKRAFPVGRDTVLMAVSGAALMTVLFDYAKLQAASESTAQ